MLGLLLGQLSAVQWHSPSPRRCAPGGQGTKRHAPHKQTQPASEQPAMKILGLGHAKHGFPMHPRTYDHRPCQVEETVHVTGKF